MLHRSLAALLLGSILWTGPAALQDEGKPRKDDPKRFLKVKEWSIRVSADLSDSRVVQIGPGYTYSSKIQSAFSGKARLKVDRDPGATMDGPLEGQLGYSELQVAQAEGKLVHRYTIEGQGRAEDAVVSLTIDVETNSYRLSVHVGGVETRCTTEIVTADFKETTKLGASVSNEGLTDPIPLPARGLRISGAVPRRITDVASGAGSHELVFGKNPPDHWLHWTITPAGEEELELEATSSEYADWIPRGDLKESGEGGHLTVQATLKTAEGKVPQQKAAKIRFRLSGVSEEPAVCMNYPRKPARSGPDLKFLKSGNGSLEIKDDGLTAETPDGDHLSAKAVVSSFDYGAWGTLRIEAEMPDGGIVVGRLKEARNRAEIPLPRRRDGSKIAEKWREETGAEGPDDEDGDDKPAGDGCEGDGLTLYEEYRGFSAEGKHVRSRPDTKDLFVLNRMKDARGKDAILFVRTLTEIDVRIVNEDELDIQDRTINLHHKAGAHRVAQHGLVVRQIEDKSQTEGVRADQKAEEGRPGQFREIRMSGPWADADELKSNVAHEILHACHVGHHGGILAEAWKRWKVFAFEIVEVPVKLVKDDKWEESGTPKSITVLAEDGTRLRPVKKVVGDTTKWVLEAGAGTDPKEYDGSILVDRLYVADEGGTHSGDSTCVMRYYVAQAYIPRGECGCAHKHDVSVRYYTGWKTGKSDEKPGLSLCDSKEDGSGRINDPKRAPHPRYGDALEGACKKRICLNDAKTH